MNTAIPTAGHTRAVSARAGQGVPLVPCLPFVQSRGYSELSEQGRNRAKPEQRPNKSRTETEQACFPTEQGGGKEGTPLCVHIEPYPCKF